MILLLFAFFLNYICTDGIKTKVGKIANCLVQIKEVAPNCAGSHCIFYYDALTVKKKKKRWVERWQEKSHFDLKSLIVKNLNRNCVSFSYSI